MFLLEAKAEVQRREMFAKQMQDYEQQQQSREKLKSRAKTLKQRRQEREQEFKSKSQQEMQRQAELKAAAENDARRDAAQSRSDNESRQPEYRLVNAAKATAKGGMKAAKFIGNKIRNRRRRQS